MPRESEPFLRTVRAAILDWKQSQLQRSLQEDQDTTKLTLFLQETARAYKSLKTYLESGEHEGLESLSQVVQAIGTLSELTEEEEMLLREYIFRDLIEYPFTYNTRLINSFQQSNALSTKIVPNK